MQKKIREYMWFPTLGFLIKDTVVDGLLLSNGLNKPKGFIVKNIDEYLENEYLKKIGKTMKTIPPYFIHAIMKGGYTELKFWLKNKHEQLYKHHLQLNAQLSEIINILTQYCYNWKQVQDSIRLSYNAIPAEDTYFKILCDFILEHTIENEYEKSKAKLIEDTHEKEYYDIVPKTKRLPETSVAVKLNKYLLKKHALNELMFSTEPVDLTIILNTLILGQPYLPTREKGGKKVNTRRTRRRIRQ
jgi:hypothetical protein